MTNALSILSSFSDSSEATQSHKFDLQGVYVNVVLRNAELKTFSK